MNKNLIAFSVLAIIFLAGCVQQTQPPQQQQIQFVCPDGTAVSNKSLCAQITIQPPATQTPALPASTETPGESIQTPTPVPSIASTQTPAAPQQLEAKCFAHSDCFYAGSACTSRFQNTPSNGRAPCELCVCTCLERKCVESIQATPTPSPTPTPVPEKINISFVKVENIQYRSVEVVWHTSLNSTSHVSFGLQPNVYKWFYDDERSSIDHWVPLGQLTHNLTYFFQVKSCLKDAAGKETACETSGIYNFSTPKTA